MKLIDILNYEESCEVLKKLEEESLANNETFWAYTNEAEDYFNKLSREKLLLFARYAPYVNDMLKLEREINKKNNDELNKIKADREQYVSHLEAEVSRLKKAVHDIYTDIKLKGMKFITNAKPDKSVSDIFLNVFENYLK